MSQASDKEFVNTLRIILDLISLLKYNLETFKGLDIHKEEETAKKNMRPDCVILLQAINAFLFKMKGKCSAETFRAISQTMQRDKLHDLSLHLDVVYLIDNLPDITAALQMEIDLKKSKTDKL